MKKFSLVSIILVGFLLTASLAFAGNPRQLYQAIFDTDNITIPDNDPDGDGAIAFEVWLNDNREEVKTQDNEGFSVRMAAGGECLYLIVQLGNFEVWRAGDVVNILATRDKTNHYARSSYVLDWGTNPIFLERIEGRPDNSIHLRERPVALFDSNQPDEYRVRTTARLAAGQDPDENGVYTATGWDDDDDDKYWEVRFSTRGFEDVSFSTEISRDRRGPDVFTTKYSVDGNRWIPYANPIEDEGYEFWEIPQDWSAMNFELPEECNNQESVVIRIQFEPEMALAGSGNCSLKNALVLGHRAEGVGPDPNPVIASRPVPEDEAQNVPVTLRRLEWRYVHADDHATPVGFKVYFGQDHGNFGDHNWVAYTEGEQNYNLNVPTDLHYGATYFWQVVPTTEDGADGRRAETRNTRRGVVRESSSANVVYRGDAPDCPVWRFDTARYEHPDPIYDQEEDVGADSTDPIVFAGTGVEIKFPLGNSAQRLRLRIFNQRPDGARPTGVDNISPLYLTIDSSIGTPGGDYNITIDISSIPGIAQPSLLKLFKRSNINDDWEPLGPPDELQDDPQFGPKLTWYGLSSFSDFVLGGNEEDGNTLPVELSSFTVSVTAQMFVELQWVTETETNMLGYRVHRASTNSRAESVNITEGSVIPAHNSSETTVYKFNDQNVEAGKTYYYWLETVDLDLTNRFHGPVSVTLEEEEEIIPEVYVTELQQNYPNPFNPSTMIKYSLERETDVSLVVYNVLGQKVKTLVNGAEKEGKYHVEWNGTDDNGKAVTSGIYFYKLSTDNYNKIHKMMLVK